MKGKREKQLTMNDLQPKTCNRQHTLIRVDAGCCPAIADRPSQVVNRNSAFARSPVECVVVGRSSGLFQRRAPSRFPSGQFARHFGLYRPVKSTCNKTRWTHKTTAITPETYSSGDCPGFAPVFPFNPEINLEPKTGANVGRILQCACSKFWRGCLCLERMPLGVEQYVLKHIAQQKIETGPSEMRYFGFVQIHIAGLQEQAVQHFHVDEEGFDFAGPHL